MGGKAEIEIEVTRLVLLSKISGSYVLFFPSIYSN